MIQAKAKGAARERQVRDLLIEQGYNVVKAGASLGMFDLVATPMGAECTRNGQGQYLMRYVQVKSNQWPPPSERAAMEAALIRVPHAREIWRRDDRKPWRVLVLMDDGWHALNGTGGQVIGERVLERQGREAERKGAGQ